MPFSSLAINQLQAMQMTFFFFLPTMLLSGFMFPFCGIPESAQILGKGNGFDLFWPYIWPILAFTGAMLLIGLKSFRKTLD